jgi:catechol 2,3-dioxygenase-like lactoylglutathione lyase family enzyme
VSVERAGYDAYTETIHPEYGRAVIVDARLSPNGNAPPPADTRDRRDRHDAATRDDGPVGRSGPRDPHHIVILGELGVSVPLHGSVGGSPSPAATLGLEYVVHDSGRAIYGLGVRATLLVDSWGNSVNAPSSAADCGSTIPTDETATALSAFLDGSLGVRLNQRWRIGGDLGFGIATYSVDQVGGDLFLPTCRPTTSPRPAVHLGGQASYALGRDFRLLFAPTIEANPAFGGARSAPKDAAGLWLRLGAFFGIALDAF